MLPIPIIGMLMLLWWSRVPMYTSGSRLSEPLRDTDRRGIHAYTYTCHLHHGHPYPPRKMCMYTYHRYILGCRLTDQANLSPCKRLAERHRSTWVCISYICYRYT